MSAAGGPDPAARTALLIVDAQRDVLAPCVRREPTLANLQALLGAARTRGLPVIWVRHQADDELIAGSEGWQITPELAPAAGEPFVEKRYMDAFADTQLAAELARLGAGAILLCGAQTDACVRSTFYGALYRGYPVTLVSDAHTTEDMRRWGAGFGPEESIAVLNQHASQTVLPHVSGADLTTAQVLGAGRRAGV